MLTPFSIVLVLSAAFLCVGIFMLAAARARSAKAESGFASDRAAKKEGRLHAMNLPAALATDVGIAAYTVVDGLGVRTSGNWIACTGGMFAFFLAVPLWYLARRQRAVFAVPIAEAGRRPAAG